jgi:hypothetical protein
MVLAVLAESEKRGRTIIFSTKNRMNIEGNVLFSQRTTRRPESSMKKGNSPRLNGIRECMAFAIENIVRYGDTDIFPYPIERQIFRAKRDETLDLLVSITKAFKKSIAQMPLEYEKLLNTVGYNGFRQATQIDPIWNAYLLGLVVFIGSDIESARIPAKKNIVFSYRFNPDESDYRIFDKDYGWSAFQLHSVQQANGHTHVLSCDIADFYPRVYHHRLENALKKVTKHSEVIHQIKYILNGLAGGVSYGLPIGGPAARLLSELLLNRTDRLLASKGIPFCRFVDDYHIFADSKEEIYSHLIYLSEALLNNEGLTVQRQKTRIMSSAEFHETSTFADINVPESPEEKDKREFIKIHIHFDPYSDTANEDYEALKEELDKFDIVGMLASEMQKTRIQEGLTRKLVKAIAHIDQKSRNQAVLSLLENLPVLYPIFPAVMLLFIGLMQEMDGPTREKVFGKIRELLQTGSYICRVPVNMAYAIRVLSFDDSEETDTALIKLFNDTESMLIRRDIVLILAKHNADYWVSDQLRRYSTAKPWERRSLLISSYILEDEGSEWRKRVRDQLTPFDSLVLAWASEQKETGKGLEF